MKTSTICVMLLLVGGLTAGEAVAPEKQALLDEYFTLTKAKEKFEIGQVAGFRAGFEMSAQTIPEDKKKKILAAGEKIFKEEMKFDDFKKQLYVEYDNVVSTEDLKIIVGALKNPGAKKMIDVELKIIEPAMKVGMQMGKEIGPKIGKEAQRIMAEP